jgi:hypothetical protein
MPQKNKPQRGETDNVEGEERVGRDERDKGDKRD